MTEKSREAPISYRPPEALREEFQARVEQSGLSVNAFITQSVFGSAPPRPSRRSPRHSLLDQQVLARLLGEAARLRTSLETLPVEGERQALLHEEAAVALQDIRTLLMQALGRER